MIDLRPYTQYWKEVLMPLQQQGALFIDPEKGEVLVTVSALCVAAGITEEEIKTAAKEPPKRSMRRMPSFDEATAQQQRKSVTKKISTFVKNMRIYLMSLAASRNYDAARKKPFNDWMEAGSGRSIAVHVLTELDSDTEVRPIPIYTIILSRQRTWHTLWLTRRNHYEIIIY